MQREEASVSAQQSRTQNRPQPAHARPGAAVPDLAVRPAAARGTGRSSIRLPQLSGKLFLADGGLESTLVFLEGFELPCNAAFHLMRDPEGREAIRRYFREMARIAVRQKAGFILETATWRASRDWAQRLGYSPAQLAQAIRLSVQDLEEIRDEFQTADSPMVISGAIGPRGDGYVPSLRMSAREAQDYHAEQIATFAATPVDFVSAVTLNYAEEAVGIVRAAVAQRMPVAISFTVETDGRLPTGQTLAEAIGQVDELTDGAAAYFMINCAHPEHFAGALDPSAAWTRRIRGIRANASKKSHAELDNSAELDDGDPEDLARRYSELKRLLPNITIMGGCCGTDHRHIATIASACAPLF